MVTKKDPTRTKYRRNTLIESKDPKLEELEEIDFKEISESGFGRFRDVEFLNMVKEYEHYTNFGKRK